MKKITLLVAAFIAVYSVQAQETFSDMYQSNPVSYNPEVQINAACTQEVVSNNLENGGLFGTQRLAIDIDVPGGEKFTIEEIIPTLIGDSNFVEIMIWNDEGGVPGSVELHNPMVEVTDDVITGSNFGFDFHQLTLTLDEPLELEGGETGEKYWMEIVTDADGWESSTLANTGLPGAFANENTNGEWMLNSSGGDYVYILVGDCSPLLGVEDNLLSGVSVYPNPTSAVFNINLPKGVEVISSSLVDVMGKTTGVTYSNGQMDVSSLAKGVYFLNIKTNQGVVTQKVVKQ